MPAERPGAPSSVFDDLLERGRRELDALAGAPGPARQHTPRPSPPAPAERSSAEHALDTKLGPGWRMEVLERLREGGELIVRCRVSARGGGASRTQFGSAPLGAGASGAVGGTPFSLGEREGTSASTEQAAERAAIEAALVACARLL